jgi:hypothetical protein
VGGQGPADVVLARGALIAFGPAASVDDDHAGMPGGVFRRQIKVGFLGPVGWEIGDVFFDAHFRGFDGQGAEWEGCEEEEECEGAEGGEHGGRCIGMREMTKSE